MTEREKVNILIVDDQPAKLLSLETIVSDLDENILKAPSAEEALRILLTHDVAVVLVDVCMPRMDGFELAELIRGHPRFGRTAIIFISAVHLTEADRLKGYDLGAVDYISVPIIPEVLKAKVAVFADLHRKTEQLKRLNQELEARVAERTADLAASNARLRASEERFQQIAHTIDEAFWLAEILPEPRMLYVSPAWERIWDRPSSDILGGPQAWLGTVHPDDRAQVESLLHNIGQRGAGDSWDRQYRIVRPDGRVRWIRERARIVPAGEIGALHAAGLAEDVTDLRAAAADRDRLAAIVASSGDAIISADLNGVIQSWNPAAEQLFQYPAAEAVGKPISAIIPTDRQPEELGIINRVVGGERVAQFQTERVTRAGGVVPVSLSVSPVYDGSGNVVGYSKIIRDLTEARTATRERDRLLAVLEATPDFVATTDAAGNIRYMNPAARRMIGLAPGENPIGLPLAGFYPADVARLVRDVAMPAAARDLTWEGETVIRSRHGVETPVSQVLIAHKNASGDGTIEVFSTVARDITERRRAEAVLTRDRETLERLVAERTAELERSNERLRMADRMATIGTLSAGLGHDMGNLLLPVRMRLEAIESTPLSPAVREDVSAIRKASDYLQRLARSLRLLAIDPEADARQESATDLASWWEDTEGMLRNGISRPTMLLGDLSTLDGPALPPVRIGKAALTQIAFNLVQNAGDILRGRDDGRVRISAQASPDRQSVRLSIADNGPGMTEETRRRCMEPFFTTKTRGMSTGLGLSLVAGLVKNAGGSIHIDSAPDRGTVFTITLPVAQPRSAQHEGDAPPSRGLAVVALADARLSAHVTAVLGSLCFEVRHEHIPPDVTPVVPSGGTELWVTQADDESDLRIIEEFVMSQPRRHAVVFAPASLPETVNGRRAATEGRLIRYDLRVRPSELRDSLRAVVTRVGVTVTVSNADAPVA